MTLKQLLKPGNKIYVKHGVGYMSKTIHIRGIIDKNNIVYKIWSKRKQGYYYHVEPIWYFEMLHNHNRLIYKGKSNHE